MKAKANYPSNETVAIIKGMVARGDRQMDVAVLHGLNQARVNEIVNGTGSWGRAFKDVLPTAQLNLPEPGPYIVVGQSGYEKLRVAAAVPTDILQRILQDLAAIKESLRNGPPTTSPSVDRCG